MWVNSTGADDFPSLGHAALDEEHQQIARLLDGLRDAIARGAERSDQRYLLHELEVYVRINCRGEEEMMAGHRQDHAELFRKLHSLEGVLLSASTNTALRELQTFRHAFLNHIQHEDARVASWHRIQSISPDSPD